MAMPKPLDSLDTSLTPDGTGEYEDLSLVLSFLQYILSKVGMCIESSIASLAADARQHALSCSSNS